MMHRRSRFLYFSFATKCALAIPQLVGGEKKQIKFLLRKFLSLKCKIYPGDIRVKAAVWFLDVCRLRLKISLIILE